jgi:hypothetical protein
VEKNGKIQNKISERIGKFYHIANSSLWNKDIGRKCKITMFNEYFKKILFHRAETWTCNERGAVNYKQLRWIF